jgi:hypothetical protein
MYSLKVNLNFGAIYSHQNTGDSKISLEKKGGVSLTQNHSA